MTEQAKPLIFLPQPECIAGAEREASQHTASIQASLAAKEAASLPPPSELRLRLMVDRLAQLDPLEAQAAYVASPAEDQRAIEAAALTVGRLPKKTGERVTWTHLLDPTVITQTIAARARRVDPQPAEQLDDLQRLQVTYRGLAATAGQIIESTLPRGRTAVTT